MTDTYSIHYPRKAILRSILNPTGRMLFRLFSRVTVMGKEHIPRKGAIILVGNHVDIIEVVLMVLFAYRHVEVIGTGDIPLDSLYAPVIRTYGYIPVNRGSMDRQGMTMALDVLKQGGAVGIFPEGGVWETSAKQARTGVAWLSSKANAPIVPIGFGGTHGVLGEMFKLKRPHMIMNVGTMIPPIQAEGKNRKNALIDGANEVMARIEELIPADEKARWQQITEEHFTLELTIQSQSGETITIPNELRFDSTAEAALAKFLHRPVLLRTFARNIKLPVQPLQQLDPQPAPIATAAESILNYIKTNPYFFTYRFGNEEGAAMQAGLSHLYRLAQWAAAQDYRLFMNSIRHYRQADDPQEHTESLK